MGTLTEPTPRLTQSIQKKDRWILTSIIGTPTYFRTTEKPFCDVAFGRRTIRQVEPMALADLLALVRFVASQKEIGVRLNEGRSRKMSVSAGGLHPIDVLIVSGPGVTDPIVYSDADDTFGTVLLVEDNDLPSEVSKLKVMLPDAKGHLLLFTGDLSLVDRAYESGLSLLWRDAGAVLQSFAFAAAAFELAFVPLGSLGTNVLKNLRPPNPTCVAVATAFIGLVKHD